MLNYQRVSLNLEDVLRKTSRPSVLSFGSRRTLQLRCSAQAGRSFGAEFPIANVAGWSVIHWSSDMIWLVVWGIDIFPYTGNNHPNWLIFFRGVGTTNQMCVCFFDNSHQPSSFTCLCLSKQSFGPICLLKPPPNLETANTRRCHGSKGCLEKTWARWCQLMVATNMGLSWHRAYHYKRYQGYWQTKTAQF